MQASTPAHQEPTALLRRAGFDLPHAMDRLLDQGFTPMVVSNDRVLPHLDLSPFGITLPQFDFNGRATTADLTTLLHIYNAMNGLAFGPRGLPMPNWVMVDLALLPSAFILLTLPQSRVRELTGDSRRASGPSPGVLGRLLDDAAGRNYDGPIPVAGYCASPTAEKGRWIGWSLCSVVDGLGLATVVKALALGVYRAKFLDGITQFDSPSLRIHTRFGKLGLRAAAVPLHTSPRSFVYETDLSAPDAVLANLAVEQPTEMPTFFLDPADVERQQEMQDSIVRQARSYTVLQPGLVEAGGRTLVPILERPAL